MWFFVGLQVVLLGAEMVVVVAVAVVMDAVEEICHAIVCTIDSEAYVIIIYTLAILDDERRHQAVIKRSLPWTIFQLVIIFSLYYQRSPNPQSFHTLP